MIGRWPDALDGSQPERPVEMIGEGMSPAAAAVLEGAGGPAVFLVSAITAVVDKVAGLPWSEVVAVFARQEV